MMAFNFVNMPVNSSNKVDHCIYKNNPMKQLSLLDKVVEVSRSDGHKITGTVFTIDPVSESIVLVRDEEGKPSMDIVMGHAVKSLSVLSDTPSRPLDDLFPCNTLVSMSAATHATLRARLKAWLLKNFLPVEEEGEVLKLQNALKIYPPYTSEQCVSDNEIILGKVQTLILSMPRQDSIP